MMTSEEPQNDLDPEVTYQLCPVCGGDDVLDCMDGSTLLDCPACVNGLVPHGCDE